MTNPETAFVFRVKDGHNGTFLACCALERIIPVIQLDREHRVVAAALIPGKVQCPRRRASSVRCGMREACRFRLGLRLDRRRVPWRPRWWLSPRQRRPLDQRAFGSGCWLGCPEEVYRISLLLRFDLDSDRRSPRRRRAGFEAGLVVDLTVGFAAGLESSAS